MQKKNGKFKISLGRNWFESWFSRASIFKHHGNIWLNLDLIHAYPSFGISLRPHDFVLNKLLLCHKIFLVILATRPPFFSLSWLCLFFPASIYANGLHAWKDSLLRQRYALAWIWSYGFKWLKYANSKNFSVSTYLYGRFAKTVQV